MNPFQMVVVIVFLVTAGRLAQPVVRAIANRISGRGLREDSGPAHELESSLSATTERLEHAEGRIADLEDKLRFVERLVASRPSRPELPAQTPTEEAEPTS